MRSATYVVDRQETYLKFVHSYCRTSPDKTAAPGTPKSSKAACLIDMALLELRDPGNDPSNSGQLVQAVNQFPIISDSMRAGKIKAELVDPIVENLKGEFNNAELANIHSLMAKIIELDTEREMIIDTVTRRARGRLSGRGSARRAAILDELRNPGVGIKDQAYSTLKSQFPGLDAKLNQTKIELLHALSGKTSELGVNFSLPLAKLEIQIDSLDPFKLADMEYMRSYVSYSRRKDIPLVIHALNKKMEKSMTSHFNDHGWEFQSWNGGRGVTTTEEYLREARRFAQSTDMTSITFKIEEVDRKTFEPLINPNTRKPFVRILKYDLKSREFLVTTEDGIFITYYRKNQNKNKPNRIGSAKDLIDVLIDGIKNFKVFEEDGEKTEGR